MVIDIGSIILSDTEKSALLKELNSIFDTIDIDKFSMLCRLKELIEYSEDDSRYFWK